ncbi:S9 family peptidase [Roseateles depolymerans]|uniref:Acyl-peptide hydrolase n=1 Tax=Roseateles depolymerans TaxID=76731 RepID=A0A0U2U8E0_9BURK|nr:S9 family peptidase [Roseateles depolymerans]ALV08241.1 Peptidase S9 prolyl oligopeptidase [Roseateles depolymerans]REG21534.1 dipeptidyl aminopeptidase/acylaminoacyl peptidase [Roseateles depolymerans]
MPTVKKTAARASDLASQGDPEASLKRTKARGKKGPGKHKDASEGPGLDVAALWAMDRVGVPSLSPDGAQVVVPVTRYDMDKNSGSSSLWLLSTLGGSPRRLTQAGDKDGQPQWSPTGDDIAFIARREQAGDKDDVPQLYLIPPDGGEARRVTHLPFGVESFKWFPDGRRIAFVSWVDPTRKGPAGQHARRQEDKDRKATGYVTEEALYRYWDHSLPMGRVPHLHVLDLDSGRVRDLFEGTDYELSRSEPDATTFDISPDGRRIAFSFDPAPTKILDYRNALAEIDVRSGRVQVLLQDADWDFSAPSYSHAGHHLAFLASHQGLKHTMPHWIAVLDTQGNWAVLSEGWDHDVEAPLCWDEDDLGVLCLAEDRGRRHLWRFDVKTLSAFILFEGGHAGAFALEAGTLVVQHDSVAFPPRVSVVEREGEADEQQLRRIDAFNDDLLARHGTGRHEEVWYEGAQGDAVQMWLIYPPGFDSRKKHPLMHVIHGGPHTAFGDSWHWRWNHQVMAAQGFVVACVNYHGSSSFGQAFLDSITHRWGELELQDIEAATDLLLTRPWADRRRVFATGGSYGGYMVAWMNGHVAPGRYQAYVCHAGCYDWQAMFANDAYHWHAKELGAAYWDRPERVAAQSPHSFAKHFNTPTLVIHGQMDYRVPDAQGLAYYNTLKARGIDARLLWFPDENHWVLKPRNSQLWYQEFFDWLKRYDKKSKKS